MATSNVLGAYDLLRLAMQQHAPQQQGADTGPTALGAPEYDPDGYGSPQGGLLGRLLALQADLSPYQPIADSNRAAPLISLIRTSGNCRGCRLSIGLKERTFSIQSKINRVVLLSLSACYPIACKHGGTNPIPMAWLRCSKEG